MVAGQQPEGRGGRDGELGERGAWGTGSCGVQLAWVHPAISCMRNPGPRVGRCPRWAKRVLGSPPDTSCCQPHCSWTHRQNAETWLPALILAHPITLLQTKSLLLTRGCLVSARPDCCLQEWGEEGRRALSCHLGLSLALWVQELPFQQPRVLWRWRMQSSQAKQCTQLYGNYPYQHKVTFLVLQ